MKMLALVFATSVLVACSRQPSAPTPAGQEPAADAAMPAQGEIGNTESPVAPGPTAPAAPDAQPAPEGKVEADYLGRWTGVEGMYLVVASRPGGGVTLEMQWDLDNRGTFDGSVTAEGLRFMRNGVAESAVHSNGDATGLKHLAGKQDCLTVKPGEGYCRD